MRQREASRDVEGFGKHHRHNKEWCYPLSDIDGDTHHWGDLGFVAKAAVSLLERSEDL